MVFMLQKEVVDRIVAEPATTEYGRLSVMVQYFCQVEKLFEVNAEAFYPRPKVTSSVVRLIPHAISPVYLENIQHFTQIVQVAFNQRRKTLRNALSGWLDEEMLQEQGIQPQRRAETLTLHEFSKLANSYIKYQCQN
jgi:16S rRNA (adenine1518-N6/adenine1519-N6)-dimethyltransferase